MKELTRVQLFQPRIITNNGGSVSCASQYFHDNIAIATATIVIVNDIQFWFYYSHGVLTLSQNIILQNTEYLSKCF